MSLAKPKSYAQSAKVINIHSKRAPKQKPKSFEQHRQRELAWILYISEGFIANVEHALAVNCVTFDNKDKALLGRAISNVQIDIGRIRRLIGKL